MTTRESSTPGQLPPVNQLTHYRELVEQLPGWRRIGDILVELGYVTPDQIAAGLEAQRRLAKERGTSIGLLEVLQETEVITGLQAQHALGYQIANCYLPALAQALAARDQAVNELHASYQQSLQTIASYAEQANRAQQQAVELQHRVEALEAALAKAQGSPEEE